MELTWLSGALLYSIVFSAAILRGITGFGFAVVTVPAVSLFHPPEVAVAFSAILQALIGFRDLPIIGKEAHWPSVGWLAASACLGVPVGVYLLTLLDDAWVRIIIAGVVLLTVLGLTSKRSLPLQQGAASAIPCGIFSGLFAGLASMPSPPAVLYFLASGMKPVQSRASMIVLFFCTSSTTLPFLYFAGLIDLHLLLLSLGGLPVFMLGGRVGTLIFQRTSDVGYQRISILLLILTAAVTAIKGLSGLL